jgi:hypothetical protein
LQVAPPEAESCGFASQEDRMKIDDPTTDPFQPRHADPAGNPPERFPEDDDDDLEEANDEDGDFDDDDEDSEENDEEEDDGELGSE